MRKRNPYNKETCYEEKKWLLKLLKTDENLEMLVM